MRKEPGRRLHLTAHVPVSCEISQGSKDFVLRADPASGAWELLAQTGTPPKTYRWSGTLSLSTMRQMQMELVSANDTEGGLCEEGLGPGSFYVLRSGRTGCQLAVRERELTPRRRLLLQRLTDSTAGTLLREAGWRREGGLQQTDESRSSDEPQVTTTPFN